MDASLYTVADPYIHFTNEDDLRSRVNESILDQDPDLQRRIREGEERMEKTGESDEDYEEAEDELRERCERIMRKEYENLPESDKARFIAAAVEARNNIWRNLRSSHDLTENEESLKQKEEDEKKGITGPIPIYSQN